jgi:hypothetical protein
MTTPEGTESSGQDVETPEQEEKRLIQELAELERPKRILELRAQIKESRKGSLAIVDSTRSCCVAILRAEENAHVETQAKLKRVEVQLEQMTNERANLEQRYSTQKKANEVAKTALEKERDDERKGHEDTRTQLVDMTQKWREEEAKRKREEAVHATTRSKGEAIKEDLRIMTKARDSEVKNFTKEKEDHNATQRQLEATIAKLTTAKGDYERVDQQLTEVTNQKRAQETAHNELKSSLERRLNEKDNEVRRYTTALGNARREIEALNNRPPVFHQELPGGGKFRDPYPIQGNNPSQTYLNDNYGIKSDGTIFARARR